jgi:hypothetical protein
LFFPLSSYLDAYLPVPSFFTFQDTNGDGVFTVQELINWIETNKLMKYEEEGRDADMDRMMETPASENQKEEQPKSETEKEKASQKS